MKKKQKRPMQQKLEDFFKNFVNPKGKTFRSDVSDFVKRMRKIDAIPKARMFWSSTQNGTYVREKRE